MGYGVDGEWPDSNDANGNQPQEEDGRHEVYGGSNQQEQYFGGEIGGAGAYDPNPYSVHGEYSQDTRQDPDNY